MKYLSKPVAIFTIPALLVLGAIGFSFSANLNAQTAEPAGTYPADHIIRITALLEFDGKPVVVNELVTCLAEGAGGSTSGRQFLSFDIGRLRVAVETPDGGMISFSTRRSFCYAYGVTWGGNETEFTVPEGWTPVLTWYDKRDPREMSEGIQYISETALTAENGRLRIIEDFAITIPEHPFSEALLADAEAQAIDRDFMLGLSKEEWRAPREIGTMIEITEDMWRNPSLQYIRPSIHDNHDRDPLPLIDFLESLGEGEGVIALPYFTNDTDREPFLSDAIWSMIYAFHTGRSATKTDYLEFGIPKANAERFGLLVSERSAERYSNRTLALGGYNARIPWMCEGNIASPDFDNPGLVHMYFPRCTHPNNLNRLVWPDAGDVVNWNQNYGSLFFDYSNKSLWVYSWH